MPARIRESQRVGELSLVEVPPAWRPALLCWLLTLSLAICCGLALRAPAAQGDVNGLGSDEALSGAAGPLLAGTAYSGAFASASDVDYLYFDVPAPETLRFDVANTLSSCKPYWIEAAPGEVSPGEPLRYLEPLPSCPMWATLLDGGGAQLGGEGSAAGSGPIEYSSYEYVEWTFSTPGRYYLVLESEYCGGHPSECQLPSFQLSYAVVPPPSGGPGGGGPGAGGTGTGGSGQKGAGGGSKGGGPGGGSALGGGPLSAVYESPKAESPSGTGSSHSLIRSLSVGRRQRGTQVRVSLTVERRLQSLDLWVLAPVGPHRRLEVVGQLLRHHPIPGRELLRVPVRPGSWLSREHYTPLVLRLRAVGSHGAFQIFQRRVLLRR